MESSQCLIHHIINRRRGQNLLLNRQQHLLIQQVNAHGVIVIAYRRPTILTETAAVFQQRYPILTGTRGATDNRQTGATDTAASQPRQQVATAALTRGKMTGTAGFIRHSLQSRLHRMPTLVVNNSQIFSL
jgi:hypothetical protein